MSGEDEEADSQWKVNKPKVPIPKPQDFVKSSNNLKKAPKDFKSYKAELK